MQTTCPTPPSVPSASKRKINLKYCSDPQPPLAHASILIFPRSEHLTIPCIIRRQNAINGGGSKAKTTTSHHPLQPLDQKKYVQPVIVKLQGMARNYILLPAAIFGLLLTSCMAANVLYSGQALGTGASLSFAAYQFVMQADCNLVLYDNGNPVWASGTNGRGSGCQCRMQYDGNLVVYTSGNQAVWASNTNRGTGRYQCILQRDRNVVVYDPQGRPIWATGTNVAAASNVTLAAAAAAAAHGHANITVAALKPAAAKTTAKTTAAGGN